MILRIISFLRGTEEKRRELLQDTFFEGSKIEHHQEKDIDDRIHFLFNIDNEPMVNLDPIQYGYDVYLMNNDGKTVEKWVW